MTVEIPLTKGGIAIVDDIDADLNQYSWHFSKYAMRRRQPSESPEDGYGSTMIMMPRVILSRILGRPLKNGEFVDHKNRRHLDNRRGNLRLATSNQNNHNVSKRKNNRWGYKGIRPKRQKWQAQITVWGKLIYLGVFETRLEVTLSYDGVARHFFKEFTNLNFPDEHHPYRLVRQTLKSNNRSGYRGARLRQDTGKWRAEIKSKGKAYRLGCFDDPQEAARAYDKNAKDLFGDKALLNFPDGSDIAASN